MRLFFTNEELEYFNIYSKRAEKTNNRIPFIVNWDGKLETEINSFLLFKTETDWNPRSHTAKNNANQIITFLDYTFSINRKWNEISHVEIRQWIDYLTKNGFASSTIIQKIAVINSLFDWCYKHEMISNSPFLAFGTKDVKRTINVLSNRQKYITQKVGLFKNSIIQDEYKEDIPTKEEVQSFYSNLPAEDKLMALFILETGVRKEELLQLTIEMINNMKESKTGKSYSLLLNAREIRIKNNKSRNITVSSALRSKLVKHYLSNNYRNKQSLFLYNNDAVNKDKTPLFISNRGNVFSHDKLNKSFKEACKKSGYLAEHGYAIAPHHLRHFFASHFIASKDKAGELTEDVFMYLAERLGHSDVETTKKYYIKIVNKMKQKQDMEKYSEMFMSEFLG